MKTIDSLGIFWTVNSDSGIHQDEVNGLIFYGFWENEFSNEVLKNLEAFASFWVDSEISVKPVIWEGNDNANLSIEVHIIKWPIKNWLLCVEKSLKWFVELGAKVAWCGAEYSSPSLGSFRQNESSGEVYAAYSHKMGFLCKSDLMDEYQQLNIKDIEGYIL